MITFILKNDFLNNSENLYYIVPNPRIKNGMRGGGKLLGHGPLITKHEITYVLIFGTRPPPIFVAQRRPCIPSFDKL